MYVLLLLLLGVSTGQHWVKVKDGYRIHMVYVTHYGNEIGNYYQPYKQTWQATEVTVPFTAQCWEGKPADFPTEQAARDFVVSCPE